MAVDCVISTNTFVFRIMMKSFDALYIQVLSLNTNRKVNYVYTCIWCVLIQRFIHLTKDSHSLHVNNRFVCGVPFECLLPTTAMQYRFFNFVWKNRNICEIWQWACITNSVSAHQHKGYKVNPFDHFVTWCPLLILYNCVYRICLLLCTKWLYVQVKSIRKIIQEKKHLGL